MNKKAIYCFTMLILILWPIHSLAVCPDPDTVTIVPKLVNIAVKADVKLDSKTGIYSYSYSIKNSSENTGCIWWFEVDIKKPEGSIDLPKNGLVNAPRFASLDIPDEDAPPMIPVTFPSLPKIDRIVIWGAGLTGRGDAHWSSKGYTYQIEPGSTLTGLIMTTYGLPAIRDFRVDPKYIAENEDIISKFGISKDELIADGWKYLNAFYESLAWKGKTIGPTAPPADFKPISFLDYIISLKHEAYKLGWIVQGRDDDKGKKEDEEKGIMKSLDQKLEKAKAELVKGDTREAIEKLKSFIHEVEALYKEDKEGKHEKEKEGHSHITSEAYALLKYNTIYLIEKLGGKVEEKEHNKD